MALKPNPETTILALAYCGDASEVALDTHAHDHLAAHKRPRAYRRLPALPRAGNGKLDRRALQQLMDQDAALAKKIMDEARERVEAGKKVLGEIAEEELGQAGIVPSDEDNNLQPELFEDGRPVKAD